MRSFMRRELLVAACNNPTVTKQYDGALLISYFSYIPRLVPDERSVSNANGERLETFNGQTPLVVAALYEDESESS